MGVVVVVVAKVAKVAKGMEVVEGAEGVVEGPRTADEVKRHTEQKQGWRNGPDDRGGS